MPDDFGPVGPRARRGAVSMPYSPWADQQMRRAIDEQRAANLRAMFTGTRLVPKASTTKRRAKELVDTAKDVKKLVESAPGLPTVNIAVPNLELPNFSIPSLHLPNVHLPDINLPGIALPNVNLPNVSLPSLNLPDIDLPDFNIPSLDVPSIDLPGIGTLDLNIPGMRVVLNLLLDLFDAPDLLDILPEIGPELLLEFVGGAVPVLGQLAAGKKMAQEWGAAAKKAYQIYQYGGQRKLILTGDPQAAADAIRRLLGRAALDHTGKAAIQTVKFTTSTAAMFADLGAASGPIISAASTLATLSMRIHAIGVQYKERKAGNLALAQPDKLDASIFEVCPTLGCYLLTCSNTSDVLGILTSDIGRPNWDIQAAAMKRKIDPLLREATQFIISSPYELQGLKMNKGIYLAPKKAGPPQPKSRWKLW